MIQRDAFIRAVVRECRTSKHLFAKIPEGGMDYRPTPKQRSTRELLQYLSMIGIASARGMVENDWASYKGLAEAAAKRSPEEFPAAMDRQAEALKDLLGSLTDEDMTRETRHVTGDLVPLGLGLMLSTYAWLVAYRHQLFLYAKAAGNAEISTVNNWVGRDPEPKPA